MHLMHYPETGAFNAAKEVYFALYTRKNPTTEQRITASVVSISKTNFDPAYSTRIYIHGMITDHTAPLPTALTAAYLKKGNFNVVRVFPTIIDVEIIKSASDSRRLENRSRIQLFRRN